MNLKADIVQHNALVYWDEDKCERQLAAIKQFAADVCEDEYLKSERAATKGLNDHVLSKIAELCGKEWLEEQGYVVSEVDFEVRHGRSKGWAPDLVVEGLGVVHVKACSQQTKQIVKQMSWTFQLSNKSGHGGRDVLFDHMDSDELVMLCFIPNIALGGGVVKYTAPWNKLNKLLKDPMVEKYVGIKKCLYEEDLVGVGEK